MSILKSLKELFTTPPQPEAQVTVSVPRPHTPEPTQKEPQDLRKAECPYCRGKLKKVPGQVTTCPHCGKDMYVRTKPDNTRVVVTEAEAERIEEEWSIVQGTHDQFLAARQQAAHEREVLRKRFGKEPSENDVQWSILNKGLIEHAQHRNWGFYRNARFQMAEMLRKEARLAPAVTAYLEVCYLDANGPNNTGGSPYSTLKDFDPERGAFLAPGVLSRIEQAAEKLKLGHEEVKQIFLKHNQTIQENLKLPMAPEACWEKLGNELSRRSSEKT